MNSQAAHRQFCYYYGSCFIMFWHYFNYTNHRVKWPYISRDKFGPVTTSNSKAYRGGSKRGRFNCCVRSRVKISDLTYGSGCGCGGCRDIVNSSGAFDNVKSFRLSRLCTRGCSFHAALISTWLRWRVANISSLASCSLSPSIRICKTWILVKSCRSSKCRVRNKTLTWFMNIDMLDQQFKENYHD